MGKLQAAGGDEKPGKSLIRYLPLAGQGQIPDPQKLTWGWSNLRYHTWSILGCHNETQEYFEEYLDEESSENLDPLELGVFFGAFNTSCYLLMKDTPSEKDLKKFGNHVVNMATKELGKPSQIHKTPAIRDKVMHIYNQRTEEYLQLLLIEAEKDRGSSAFVKTTCGILNRLYEDEKSDEEIYDPIFASIVLNHINAFGKLIKGEL